MSHTLRLGLIGAGRWGRNYIRTIGALPGMRLARLASRSPDSAPLVPAGCQIFAGWRDLLDPRVIDGIIIATPPALHAEMALAAIDLGLPVLVEKPLTLNVAEAHAVLARARERGVLVMVGHTHLFHPAYRAVKSMQPRYGRIHAIVGEASNRGPYRPDVSVLWDWGAHDVAMCLDLLGAPPKRAAVTILEHRPVEGGIGESVQLELAFANGVSASLRLSNLSEKRRRLAVQCERGLLVYDDLAAQKLIVTEGTSEQAIGIADDPPLSVAVREFAAATAARSRDLAGLELGTMVVEVLASCAAAAEASAAGP